MGRPNLSRETKLLGADEDWETFIFPLQLTMSKIGNHTRLIHTLLRVLNIHSYVFDVRISYRYRMPVVCMYVNKPNMFSYVLRLSLSSLPSL